MIVECIILGFLIAIVSVFTGLGGGVVMTPLLPVLFGFTQLQTIATSLFVVFLNGLQLILLSRKKKLVDVGLASKMGLVGVLVSFLTSLWIYHIPSRILQILMLCILSFSAFLLFTNYKIRILKSSSFLTLVFIGAFAGFTSAISGLGGGIVVGPLLLALSLSQGAMLAPTVSFVSTVFAGTAVFTHLLRNLPHGHMGPIRLEYAGIIFVSAFVFSRLIFNFQGKITDRSRRQIMLLMTLILLLITALRLLGYIK